MKLAEFLDTWGEALEEAVLEMYPPVYTSAVRETCGYDMGLLLRRPLGAQADAIRALAISLRLNRGTLLIGEMGVGKSLCAAAAAWYARFTRPLVMCPPHLVRKWVREVEDTVPNTRAVIVKSIHDLDRLRFSTDRVLFTILSREKAKLGYAWKNAAILRRAKVKTAAGNTAWAKVWCCPDCYKPVLDDENIPLGIEDLDPNLSGRARRRRCDAEKLVYRGPKSDGSPAEMIVRPCGAALWAADLRGPQRFPLADYIRQHMGRYFDLLIPDEVHELKARGSAQGLAAAGLAEACGRTLALTGTLLGGYSSTVFNIAYRFSPQVRADFAHNDEKKWVRSFGFIERITYKEKEDDGYEEGRRSKRKTYKSPVEREKPGVTPPILFNFIGNTVFLRLSDVARDLPPYTERVVTVPLDTEKVGQEQEIVQEGWHSIANASQATAYGTLASDLYAEVARLLALGSKRLLGIYLQSLLSWPDNCVVEELVHDPVNGNLIASAPALPSNRLYPKERQLVADVLEAKANGRRYLGFITHTEKRDLTPRVQSILQKEGLRVAVLKANTVKPENREDWVAEQVALGCDVLLTNPRLVQTGLDLIDFPEVGWIELDYSTYVARQASRRSWRIGQTLPVRVTYYVYDGTLQAQALALVAAKMRASLMIEGDLSSEGLAAVQTDDTDLYLALARKLALPDNHDSGTLEALFAEARQLELANDSVLGDPGWAQQAVVEVQAPVPELPAARILELPAEGLAGLKVDTSAFSVKRRKQIDDGQLTLF